MNILKKIFEKKTLKSPDERIKHLEFEKKFLFVWGLILFGLILVSSFMSALSFNNIKENYKVASSRYDSQFIFPDGLYQVDPNVTLNYTDLNSTEILLVQSVYDVLNKLYLLPQDKIIFAKNITLVCGENCGGVNIDSGREIYVKYTNDTSILKVRLCHEVLHTFFKYPQSQSPFVDPVHAVVYAASRSNLCYKSDGEEFLEEKEFIIARPSDDFLGAKK